MFRSCLNHSQDYVYLNRNQPYESTLAPVVRQLLLGTVCQPVSEENPHGMQEPNFEWMQV